MSETPHTQNDPSPENMQLTIDALNAHPGIVVVGGFERSFLNPRRCPPLRNRFAHTLEIFAHPTTPVYEPEALNELATTLIGDRPTEHKELAAWVNYTSFAQRLRLPSWRVHDTIGSITLQGAVRPNGTSTVVKTGQLPPEIPLDYEFELLQSTTVTIFPDIHHIADAITNQFGLYSRTIPRDELGKSENADVEILKHAPALGYEHSPEVDHLLKLREDRGSIPPFVSGDA